MNRVKKILYADDDLDDRGLFCDALMEIDPSIVCFYAQNGIEVFTILDDISRPKPNLIFLDINMPAMNGWECLVALKNNDRYKDIPVLIYSTSSHQRDADVAIDLGALCFFTKPNSFEELKSILQTIVANVNGNILHAVSHYNAIKFKKVFACTDDDSAH